MSRYVGNIRRDDLSTWWHDHRLRRFPTIEVRPSPDIATTDGCNTPWACSERGDCPIVQDVANGSPAA